MSANQKKALAVLAAVLFSVLIGAICAFAVSALGASPLASVSAGGGAFVVVCGLSVVIIGLFDFTDSRPTPPASPQGAPTPMT